MCFLAVGEMPETDHVTSGLMRGLEKKFTDGADKQTDKQTERRTWQLYD